MLFSHNSCSIKQSSYTNRLNWKDTNQIHCSSNRINYKIGQNSYHWLNDIKSVDEKIKFTSEGRSYFEIPHFGKNYSFKSLSTLNIQKKECDILNEAETQNHLNLSKSNALKQQEEKRRITSGFDLSKQSFVEKILTYLFMGSPKPVMDTVKVEPQDVANIKTESEEIKELSAVAAWTQGLRESMEDAHLAVKFDLMLGGMLRTIMLTAVFDGHQGDECAEFAAKNLEEVLKAYLSKFNSDFLTDAGITNALCLSLIDVSHAYNPENVPGSQYNLNAGCTANVVIQIDNESIFVANCGDSRAIILDENGNSFQISEDATIEGPYQNEIIERGGTIIPVHGKSRVNGRLAVPASLGDHWSNGIIISRPNIVKLENNEFNNFNNCTLIQCCDGVFEVATTEDVAARLNKSINLPIAERAKDIVESAFTCGSSDNISVLLRQFPKKLP